MKKILLIPLLFCMISMSAQDVIITTDAQKIEAKITEVSKSEVRYKDFDNQNGPMFVLGTEDISTIIYSSGKVVFYNNSKTETVSNNSQKATQQVEPKSTPKVEEQIPVAETTPQPVVDENAVTILTTDGKTIFGKLINMNNGGITFEVDGQRQTIFAEQLVKVALANGQIKTYHHSTKSQATTSSSLTEQEVSAAAEKEVNRIYRDNGEFRYKGVYISSRQVGEILKKEDAEAYKKWSAAGGYVIGGGVLAGVGLGLVGGSFAFIKTNVMATLGMCLAGAACAGVSIGLIYAATARYNAAISIYNAHHNDTALRLNFYASPTDIGIALNF